MPSADFSLFVVTTLSLVRPHGISHTSFLVYPLDLRIKITVAFWTSLSVVSLSAMYALYQVSVRQATISLSLLLAHISRCKPWESLWGSLATTPLVDFHHRLTAYPSYKQDATDFPPHLLYYRFFLILPYRSAANTAADTKRRIPQIASVKESPVAGAGSAASLLSSTNRSVLFPFSLGSACTGLQLAV